MSFIVIICSKCKWARGARTDSKRVKCTRCGATIDVRLARPFAHANNELELAKAVGDVNQKVMGKGKTTIRTQIPKDVHVEHPAKPKAKGDRETILELAKKMGEFGLDDALGALAGSKGIDVSSVDIEKTIKTINELLTKGLLFEARYGRYKAI
jgi:hypothetical protein